MLEELLKDIRLYLHITWKDPELDKNIKGFISRGMARLNNIAGVSLDFLAEDLPRQLLFDYCRYANSQVLEMFETNFQGELLTLHIMNQAKVLTEVSSDEN